MPTGSNEIFWAKANVFLEEQVGTAVNDLRHSHLAKTIFVREFRYQVAENYPIDTPIDELILSLHTKHAKLHQSTPHSLMLKKWSNNGNGDLNMRILNTLHAFSDICVNMQ